MESVQDDGQRLTPRDPLERIADALERIAAVLEAGQVPGETALQEATTSTRTTLEDLRAMNQAFQRAAKKHSD